MANKAGWMRALRGALALGLATAAGTAAAYTTTGNGWNIPEGVSEISRHVHYLNTVIFAVCAVIGVVVFGAMIWSIIAHRRSVHPKPADFHESTAVEIAWTVVPFLILIGMAIPAAGTLIKMEDVSGAELSIKVTGFQWKWRYDYIDQNVGYFSTLAAASNAARQVGAISSGWAGTLDRTTIEKLRTASGGNYLTDVDNPLVLPVGKKIKFLITANDVIHAWWVPDFAIKKDAIPGYVNEVWTKIDKPGVYRGVCAELCGRDHGFMPIVVQALPEEEFNAWLAQAKKNGGAPATAEPAAPAPKTAAAAPVMVASSGPIQLADAAPAKASQADLVANGKKVYTANCAACHQAEGQGQPPTFPALKGSKIANGPAEAHINQILKGKNMMPSFSQLSDADIAAVATFERTSWGNKGSVIQAAQVAAQRGK